MKIFSGSRHAKGMGAFLCKWGIRIHPEHKLARLAVNGSISLPEGGQSVLFFTTHKCASSFMNKALALLNEKYLKLTYLNLASYLASCTSEDVYEYLNGHAEVFSERGALYGPLRRPVSVPHPERFCVLLMLRDPRDVLVSHYYSSVKSHPVPRDWRRSKIFLERRSIESKMTLDEFVLMRMPHFMQLYTGYQQMAVELSIRPLKYEEMVCDFDAWLNSIESALQLTLSLEDRVQLCQIGGFDKPVEENASLHIRKRTPGDFREKLQPATIEQLNEKFAGILDWLELPV